MGESMRKIDLLPLTSRVTGLTLDDLARFWMLLRLDGGDIAFIYCSKLNFSVVPKSLTGQYNNMNVQLKSNI